MSSGEECVHRYTVRGGKNIERGLKKEIEGERERKRGMYKKERNMVRTVRYTQ